MQKIILLGLLLLFTCTGCVGLLSVKDKNSYTIEKWTAKEILTEDPEADIFQYNGLIYSNTHQKEFEQDVNLEKGKQISKIIKQTTDSAKFVDGSATKLPVDTKIYQVPDQGLAVLTIIKNDQRFVYIAEIK